jgi:DNA-directed RNA polymerase specialized sigma24 family protein
MSVADAADVLNTTKKAVESRLYRARQKLREQLGKWLL